jgi:hypothetical protein
VPRCKESLCAFVRKKKECSTIGDCLRSGLCQEDTACACTNGYCGAPWWVAEDGDCRTDQVTPSVGLLLPRQDCEATVGRCRGGRCLCGDLAPRNQWESRGTCKLRAGGL